MMRARRSGGRSAKRGLAAAILATSTLSGCSFLFVDTVPDGAEQYPPDRPIECTSRRLVPILDVLVAGYQVVRTLVAVANDDSEYADAPISRGADIGFGIGFTALFTSSAIYGFYETGECREAKSRQAAGAQTNTSLSVPSLPFSAAFAPAGEHGSNWALPSGPSWARPLPLRSSFLWAPAVGVDAAVGSAELLSVRQEECASLLRVGDTCLGVAAGLE